MSDTSKKQRFVDWVCSFSGCDGGEPNSDIWICGIEHGTSASDSANRAPIDSLEPEGCPFRDGLYFNDNAKNHTYNRLALALINGYKDMGLTSEDYTEQTVNDKQLFERDGIGFKMNMMPLAFRGNVSRQWDATLSHETGISSLAEYIELCMTKRAAFFRQQIQKSPKVKLIICTALGHRNDFKQFFNVGELQERMLTIQCLATGKTLNWRLYYGNIHNTDVKVFVIPFLGYYRNCLNSYEKADRTAQEIKRLMQEPAC